MRPRLHSTLMLPILLHILLPLLLLSAAHLQLPLVGAAAVDECALSFSSFDSSLVLFQFRTVAHHCPADCPALLVNSSSTSSSYVYGSYPYHGRSSICLAAVHSGLIDATPGGSVFVNRFYRHDWSSTASIFPQHSAAASLSNGVRSRPVPPAWSPEPAGSDDWSYTVRGRGEWAVQRRSAPWSGRSGHLHTSLSTATRSLTTTNHLLETQLILGGYNGTSYLNDVWISQRDNASSPHISDIRWSRLPDAPFSQRAHMHSWLYNAGNEQRLVIAGGQSGHRCGLRELGVCENDVWEAALGRRSVLLPDMGAWQEVVGLTWLWSNATNTTQRLPFSPRCDAALLSVTDSVVAIVGGQLSADSCDSAPLTVNEVWLHSTVSNASTWSQAVAPPFAGRRSMRVDESLTLFTSGAGSGTVVKHSALVGGLRYLNVSGNASTGTAKLIRAQLWSDVWLCSPLVRSTQPTQCSWMLRQPDGQTCPATSVPLPSAGGAAVSPSYTAGIVGLRFGGVDSAPNPHDGSSALPSANVSLFARPYPLDAAIHCADVSNARRGVPSSAMVGEAQLSAADGSWNMGSSWVQAHAPWKLRMLERPPTDRVLLPHSSLHYQSHSLAATSAQASLLLPQPLSSANSTRPLFRFPLRRLGHAGHAWASAVDMRQWMDVSRPVKDVALVYNFTFGLLTVSGGHSGSLYSNDWITLTEPRCLPPDDPSFHPALGPLHMLGAGLKEDLVANSYVQEAVLQVDCERGRHWEPSTTEVVSVLCAPNGLWMDAELLAPRRCVPDSLNCEWPGEERDFTCSPPVPIIEAVLVSDARSVSPLSVLDVSMSGSLLTIIGRFFAQPVQVEVGGHPCEPAELLGAEAALRRFNVSFPPHTSFTSVEQLLHSRIECSLPFLFGFNLPITVYSGAAWLHATTYDSSVATLSSTAPVIDALVPTVRVNGSHVCAWSADSPLALLDCDIRRGFDVYVCVDQRTFREEQASVWLASVIQLRCSGFEDPAYMREVAFDTNVTRAFLQSLSLCTRCSVLPTLGSPLPVRVRHTDQQLESAQMATISFAPCPRGFYINPIALLHNDPAHYYDVDRPAVCLPCPRGSTSWAGQDLDTCEPCQPGSFSAWEASERCERCPPGRYSEQPGAFTCPQCPRNSFQQRNGSDSCQLCDGDRFLQLPSALQHTPAINGTDAWAVYGYCAACPEVADCDSDGTIRTRAQLFLLINQQDGSFDYATCPGGACLAGAACTGSPTPVIRSSQLPVLNCCGAGRRPAYVPDDQALAGTEGVNVLCAVCQDGHAEVNGRCVWCPGTRWGAMLPLLLVVLAITFLLHRLPHNQNTSALMTVGAYFVQQSALMLAALPIPQLFSLFNFNVLGDHNRYNAVPTNPQSGSMANATLADSSSVTCIVPLSDTGKVGVALLSPLLFVAMLLLVAALQLLARSAIRRSSRWLSVTRPGWPVLLYCRVFMAPPPRVVAAVHVDPRLLGPQGDNQQPSPVSNWLKVADTLPPLQYQRTAVRLLLLSYTSLALTSLLFFRYQDVGVYGKRLVDYPQLDPASPEYRALLPFVVLVVLLVVVGLPLSMLLFLYRQRRMAKRVGGAADVPVVEQPLQSAAIRSLEAQLRGVFPSEYWWMTPFILLRRLLTVLVLLLAARSSTWIWMTAVHFSLLAIHLRLHPFARSIDNACETVILSALAMQAVVLSLEPPPSTGVGAQVLLGLLATTPLLLLVGVFFRDFWVRQRQRWQRLRDRRLQAQSLLVPADDSSRLDQPLLRADPQPPAAASS